MTVIAAEAVPAAETATTAAGAATAVKAAKSSKAAKAAPQPGFSTKTTNQQRAAQAREITYTTPEGTQRSAVIPNASVPEHTWHRWIMAEFILAVVLVGASPFLRPGGPAAKDTPSLAAPLVRLTAVSLIYFILALMAQGPRSGKVAAAFGALVLAGTAFNSLPEFRTIANVFAKGGRGDQGTANLGQPPDGGPTGGSGTGKPHPVGGQ